jgi:hypothetical protein
MELFEELTTMEEMVQALKEEVIHSNCRITGFEVYKISYFSYTKDVCISWWDYNGHQQPADLIINCSNEEEQDEVYSKWWQAIEIAGGKTRRAFEDEQEVIAKENREWEEKMKAKRKAEMEAGVKPDWMRALGL